MNYKKLYYDIQDKYVDIHSGTLFVDIYMWNQGMLDWWEHVYDIYR